jgi:membrane protein
MSAPAGKAALAEGRALGHGADQFWLIPWAGWKRILTRTWEQIGHDDVALLAAGVAFYSFLAFVPLLAAVVLVYGLVADPGDAARQMAQLTNVLPHDAARVIGEQLTAMTQTRQSRTALGLLSAIALAIYGSMRGATSVISALNRTYGENETRSIVRTTGLSLIITLGMIVALLAALAAIAAMSLIGSIIHLPPIVERGVTGGAWLATTLVVGILIAAVYRYGPDREDAKWLWLIPGALFASAGALLGTLLFGLYVSRFASYNATYGALGAVVCFLMWLYLTAYVLLVGSEFNAEIEHQTARDTTDGPELPMGIRGAQMADTLGDAPSDPAPKPMKRQVSHEETARGIPGLPSDAFKAVVATRLLPLLGARVGAVPVTMIVAGARRLARRDGAVKGVAMLGLGVFLVIRPEIVGKLRKKHLHE